jgi:ribosomal protein L15
VVQATKKVKLLDGEQKVRTRELGEETPFSKADKHQFIFGSPK